MNKKYIISGIVGAILLSFTTAFALTITKPTITDPVFKAVYIWWPAHQSALCASSSGTFCMDQVGFYRNEIPWANSNILKWNNWKITIGGLTTADIPDNIINSTHIFNTTILPGDFDINYLNFRIPTAGEFARTTGNCWPGRAATGMNAWVMRCVSVDFLTGLALPNCGAMGSWYTLTFTGNQWVCLSNIVNVLWADGGDYRSWATTWDIRNKNTGNVWVGLTNPTEKLTVQDSFSVNWWGGASTPEMIFCKKTNTWVAKNIYNMTNCAVCPSGYTYNAGNKLCEKTTSTYVSEPQKIFSSTIGFPSCWAANGKTYYNWDSVPKNQLCTNGKPLVNSWLAIMWWDNEGKFEWGCYLVDPNRETPSAREDNRYEIQDCSLKLLSGTKNIDYSIPMCNDVRTLTRPGYYDCIVWYITLSNYQNWAYDRGCRTWDLEVKCNFTRGRNSAGLLCPAWTFLNDKNITINEFYPTSPSSPFPVPNKLLWCSYDNNYPRTFKCWRPKDDPIFDSIATEFGKNLIPYYIDDIYYYRNATKGNIWSYLKLDLAKTWTSWSPYFSTSDGSPSGDPSYESYNRINKLWLPESEWVKYDRYIKYGYHDEIIMSTSYKDAYCSWTTNKWFASYALNHDGYAGYDKFPYEWWSCTVVWSKKSCYSQRDQYRRGVAGSEVACCYNWEAQCQFWQQVSPNSADVRVCALARNEYIYTTTTSPAVVCDPSNPLDSVCFTPGVTRWATTLLVKDSKVAINSDDVDRIGSEWWAITYSCEEGYAFSWSINKCVKTTCSSQEDGFYENWKITISNIEWGEWSWYCPDGEGRARDGDYGGEGASDTDWVVHWTFIGRDTQYIDDIWRDWSIDASIANILRSILTTRAVSWYWTNIIWDIIASGDACFFNGDPKYCDYRNKYFGNAREWWAYPSPDWDPGDGVPYPYIREREIPALCEYNDKIYTIPNGSYLNISIVWENYDWQISTHATCTTDIKDPIVNTVPWSEPSVLLVNWLSWVRSTENLSQSDIRIKTNIQKINNALADITRLNGYEFTWIEWSKPDFGVLAQEVEKVFASMVSEDSKGIKAVNYTELLAPIIEAIHEINTRVDELTREAQEQALRIETLEGT